MSAVHQGEISGSAPHEAPTEPELKVVPPEDDEREKTVKERIVAVVVTVVVAGLAFVGANKWLAFVGSANAANNLPNCDTRLNTDGQTMTNNEAFNAARQAVTNWEGATEYPQSVETCGFPGHATAEQTGITDNHDGTSDVTAVLLGEYKYYDGRTILVMGYVDASGAHRTFTVALENGQTYNVAEGPESTTNISSLPIEHLTGAQLAQLLSGYARPNAFQTILEFHVAQTAQSVQQALILNQTAGAPIRPLAIDRMAIPQPEASTATPAVTPTARR